MKFWMLTILKDKKLHANIYSNKTALLEAIDKFSYLPRRLFELTQTESEDFDLAVIKKGKTYVAALGAKEKIENNEFITKCIKKEIDLKTLTK